MTSPLSRARTRNAPRIFAISILSFAVLGFALLFALANDDWTVVRMPTPPWSASPSTPVFEARLSAIMLVALCAGAIAASLVWRRVQASAKRKLALERARATAMEAELIALGRLVSSERDRNHTACSNAERRGDPH